MDTKHVFTLVVLLGIVCNSLIWIFELDARYQLLVVPIVIVYGIFVFFKKSQDKNAADSVYYLGFIFTLSSLFFSLIPLVFMGEGSLGEDAHVMSQILSSFSVALSSTFVALIIRTVIIQYFNESEDSDADIETALNKLILSLAVAENNLQETLSSFCKTLSESSINMNKSFSDSSKNMNKSFKLLSTNVDNNNVQINKVLSESASVVEKNNSAYAKYGELITENNSKFSDATQQIYGDINAVSASYNKGMGDFVTVTDGVVKNLSTINSLVTDNMNKAVHSTEVVEMINGHLEQLNTSLSALSQGIKEFEGSCSNISGSQERLLIDYSQAKKTHEELNLLILENSNKVIEELNNKLSNS